MILAVNIGNTNIAIASFFNGEIKVQRYNYKKYSTQEKFINLIITDILKIADIKDIIIASVVPYLTPIISETLYTATGIKPNIVDTNTKFPLDFSAYDSKLLGVDRMLCCVAGLNKYKPPIIIFDLGTAITINVIDNKGNFLGGAILAGIQMSLNALTEGTALLPKAKLIPPTSVIGKDTQTCLTSGAIYGTVAIIDGMSLQIEKELGYKCNIILTGGNSEDIITFYNKEIIYEPNLLLEGLIIMQRR